MNSAELAANVLSQLESSETAFNPPELDEKGKRNAARMMQEIVCQRLRAGGATLEKQRGSRYLWGDGIILIRNGRVGGGFLTNVPPSQLDDLRRVMADHPAIFLFGYSHVRTEPASPSTGCRRLRRSALELRPAPRLTERENIFAAVHERSFKKNSNLSR